MIEHKYGEYHLQYSATCISDGLEVAYCSICGNNDYRSIPSEGHKFSKEYTVDVKPSCQSHGQKSQHCENCDERINVTDLPVLEHNFEWKKLTNATCTQNGVRIGYCVNCGVDTFELIYATGHAVTSTYVSPTCTEEGYDLYTCENCDYEYKEPIEPATSHKYEWSLIREKSCTEDKVIFGKCLVCGDITIKNEPAAGHTDNNGDGICDVCVKEDVPVVPVCSHSCHSGGFFWKISVFFFKLFGINKYCECGVAHY